MQDDPARIPLFFFYWLIFISKNPHPKRKLNIFPSPGCLFSPYSLFSIMHIAHILCKILFFPRIFHRKPKIYTFPSFRYNKAINATYLRPNVLLILINNRIKERDSVMKKCIQKLKREWDLYVLLLPGLVWFILFAYVPMSGLIMAFQDYNLWKGMSGSEFVGFKNFIDFMSDDVFWRTVKNTLLISLYRIAFCFPAPIILAILLTEMKNKFFRKVTQTVTFVPYFISMVVVCGMVVNFLAPSTGIANIILRGLGLEEHYFMVDPKAFRPIYTGMMMWRETGFNAIVYIAALMGIDRQLYEAAKVDGASKWQQIRYITIPGILPMVVVMLVLNVGKIVQVGFESILLLYNPATYETADVISTYVFRTGLTQQNYGLATAAGLFESVIVLVLVVASNKISKALSENSLW